MQRLIDANELLKDKVSNAYISRFEIEKGPTIDAEPVAHGHWVKRYKSKYYHCSICGGLVEDEWHNCPHCRAKMDEEQECEI